jgi:hypothetical protein
MNAPEAAADISGAHHVRGIAARTRAIETAYALKQLVQAGVRVSFYLEDRERTLDSPTDKVMLSLQTFADELEREKARQRVTDAMVRKARAGYVTGGRCFGYTNVEIRTADGRRSHVEREIEEGAATIVREIFARCAAGQGVKQIARALNARGVPTSQPRRGACLRGWAPSAVRAVLHRRTYLGERSCRGLKKIGWRLLIGDSHGEQTHPRTFVRETVP